MLILGDFGTPLGSPLDTKNRPKTLPGRSRATLGTFRGLRGRFWILRGWSGEPPGSILEPPGSILESPGVVFGASGLLFRHSWLKTNEKFLLKVILMNMCQNVSQNTKLSSPKNKIIFYFI